MISDLSRASATRLTLLTQAVTVALGAAAVGLIVVGLPQRDLPQPTPVGTPPGMPAPGTGQNPSQTTPVAFQPVDMGGLAERLGMIANAPAAPVVETPDDPETPTTGGEPTNEPAQPFASRVRYLGLITIGGSNAAFVSIDNRQRIVKEGDVVAAPAERPELGDLTIVRIERAKITVAHEDGDAEIALADRDKATLTMVEADPADPAAGATQPVLDSRFENNGNGTRRPQDQIDRRRRALERQRNSDPRDYDGPGLVMPDNIRRGNIGNRRRADNSEQPENTNPENTNEADE